MISLVAGGRIVASLNTDLIDLTQTSTRGVIKATTWSGLLYCTRDASLFNVANPGLIVLGCHQIPNEYNVAAITGLPRSHPLIWEYLDWLVMHRDVDEPGVLTTLLKLRTVKNAAVAVKTSRQQPV